MVETIAFAMMPEDKLAANRALPNLPEELSKGRRMAERSHLELGSLFIEWIFQQVSTLQQVFTLDIVCRVADCCLSRRFERFGLMQAKVYVISTQIKVG